MFCPYCKKELKINTEFCPHCGQNITEAKKQSQIDDYWEKIDQENIKYLKKYKRLAEESKREANIHRNKKMATIIIVLAIIIISALSILKFQQYRNNLIDEVKIGLVDKTLTAHSTHMEGLGWIHHEYWQLTFIDEENLDYSYIQTVGPAEDDEKPVYKGTYSYKVSRSIVGKYTIKFNGNSFELRVNDENIPKSISR